MEPAAKVSLVLTVPQLSPSTENGGLTPSRPDFKSTNSHDAPQSEAPMSPTTWRSDNETLKELHIPKEPGPEGEKPNEVEDRPRRRRLVFWIAIGFIIFLVIAIAVGVGVGIGVTRHKNSSSPRYVSICTPGSASIDSKASAPRPLLRLLRRLYLTVSSTTAR